MGFGESLGQKGAESQELLDLEIRRRQRACLPVLGPALKLWVQ